MTTNPVTLQHYRVLGINRSSNTGIYMINEQAVVYFSGNNLVLHNLDSREQRFLPYTDINGRDARCVAITANATMLAFATDAASNIYMIDLQSWSKRPTISLPTGVHSPTQFSALAFSGNGKLLIAQGASADANLFYFDVGKMTLITHTKVTPSATSSKSGTPVVTCISFNPNDPQFICCTGRGIFRQFTKNDKGLLAKSSSMAGKDTVDFQSHIWTLDGRTVIVAMGDGKLAQVDSSSVLIDINITNPTGHVVTHLTATQKGFACVTGGTRLHFFERAGEKGWQETSSLLIDEKEKIEGLSLAQADDHITVLLSDARLLSVPLSQTDQTKQNEQQGSGEVIVPLLPAHHTGEVVSIDVAFRKQLLVSCGKDHSIRVWNYEKMQPEIVSVFPEEALCVSFHPNGCCIAVGFPEKLRYMAITINSIVIQKELSVRGCHECRFSHGGQYLAAVNGNNIQIFSSYTFKSLGSLRSPGQKVKTISWSTDDNVLVSCDANGSMTLHTVRTSKQRAASNAQSFYFTSLVCLDAVGTKCIGVTLPDNVLRLTEDCATRDQLDILNVPCQVALGPNNKCIFVSTRDGTVLTYPLTGSNLPSAESSTSYTLHRSPISALVTSPDNQYLFTAGEDGCIYMMRIVASETQTTRSAANAIQFSEDILIARTELVDQLRALRRAQQDVIDLDNEQKYKLDSLSQGYKQKRKEIKEKITEEQASEQANADELLKQITALNEDAEAQRGTIETQYRQDMQQKMNRFEMNMANEQEQQEQLKKEKEEAAQRGQEEHDRIVAENNRHTEQITLEFEQTLADLESQRSAIAAEKHAFKEEFNRWEVAIGRELAFEIGKREYEAQQQREIEKEQTAILIEKSEAADAELSVRRQNVATGREGLQKQTQAVADLKEKIMKAKHEKQQLQTELAERKESINEKQIKIEELTNKNITLEKHKQLVNDRIADRKKELEPKQAKQQDLEITHERMSQELERYEKNDEQLRLELNELRLKIEAKKAEIEVRTKQLEDVKQITRQFKLEAHTVYEKLQEDETKEVKTRKQFAPALAALYRKYVGDEAQGASQKKSKVTDIQVERNRERDALERNITAVARRINRGDEEHARQHSRMMEENVMLMTQISELRRQNENLLKRQRVIEESSKSTYTAEELNKILEMQKDRIAQLTEQLKQLQLRGNIGRRVPVSRERLPPMNPTEGN